MDFGDLNDLEDLLDDDKPQKKSRVPPKAPPKNDGLDDLEDLFGGPSTKGKETRNNRLSGLASASPSGMN